MEQFSFVAFVDEHPRIRVFRFRARMPDFGSVFGIEMPRAFPVLQHAEQAVKHGFVRQHQRVALAVAHMHVFPRADHHVPRRICIFESIEDRCG